MTSSALESLTAKTVLVSDRDLSVELTGGQTISIPLTWYPRLAHANQAERNDWQLVGHGSGIHWPKLDEDISVASLLEGRRSGETEGSLSRWLQSRSL